MAKLVAPLFSLDVRGTLAKTLTYGANQYGGWVRRIVKRGYSRTTAQDLIRSWFKSAIVAFKNMSAEERFLWALALTNYEQYGSSMSRNFHRWARCLFLHHVLTDLSFSWEGSPFPPGLWSMLATDEIEGYSQIMDDVETLTALSFCEGVNPYFFKYLGVAQSPGHPGLGDPVAGLASLFGSAIALTENYYNQLSAWQKKNLVAHELTHSLMQQHGWNYGSSIAMSEQIANECGVRVANGSLSPVYQYNGNTLSELVENPSCS